MISSVKRLTRSKFVRNVAIVASGTAGAQAITMAFAPLITRLYGPEAFGELGTFTALLAILAPLAALSYPIAIVLPKRDADAIGIAKLSIGIALASSFLVTVILAVFKENIVNLFNLQAIEPLILFLPLAMLFSAAMAIMSQWVIRKKLFKLKAKVAVLQSLWLNGIKAGVGLISPLAAVLIVTATLNGALHAVMLWIGTRKSSDGKISLTHQTEDVAPGYKTLAWRHRDFPYYRTPQIVLNAASQGMPILMLSSFFGPIAAGYYALSRMVLAMPTALIGSAVGDTFYPRISDAAHNKEKLSRLVLKATWALILIGIIPFGVIVIFGPHLFSLVFGQDWAIAGHYARWLALWLFFMFANQPAIKSLAVISAQRFHLIFSSFTIALRALALTIGYKIFNSDLVSVALFGLISMALNIALILVTYYLCVKYDNNHKATA